MLTIYKKVDDKMIVADEIEKGCWVNLCNPNEDEIKTIIEKLELDPDWVRAALDDEESARIESENGSYLIIVDMPIVEAEGKSFLYTTIPLGIIIVDTAIVTVSLKSTPLFTDFADGKIKTFFPHKKTRFLLQLLYRNATRFLQYLKQIDKTSTHIQNDLTKSTKNKELFQLLALEKSLVYFSTSLTSNDMVLDKLKKYDFIKKYDEDIDLIEDVIIENKQAIEMCNIYRDILSGTMDAFASVISNNLNIVMKLLAAITIVMAIPTLIASIWGMNVPMPFETSRYGFLIVAGSSILISALVAYIMHKKKMF
ncbi:MAG: magnesium transporter [Clostridiales bacterium GWF2_38_85]|nr:MAG: magnesium transporter [Clostridiales bacterium GWF2_38_85]HBL85343.1 magnesium transporter [Clostridiales bacterium]